ncbi:2OG-Fe(II) oxygenase [Corynebacterium anserum]|uniref:2OG-Fe(II) oxygenase n=1 Tax=Corynebacterium anserum TaxID=2684406 RepID=UPI00163E5F4E
MTNNQLIKVIDDALPEDLFAQALKDIQTEKLSATLGSINPIFDGFASRGPAREGFDPESKWRKELFQVLTTNSGIDVKQFYWRSTIYASGSGISWHLDQGDGRSYAFNYYCIDTWDIDWGGELLYLNKPVSTRQGLSEGALSSAGSELQLIYPRPNRLALIYPGCAHRVTPVSKRAGDHYRSTWTGFAF